MGPLYDANVNLNYLCLWRGAVEASTHCVLQRLFATLFTHFSPATFTDLPRGTVK
jgi:hypothetical protein